MPSNACIFSALVLILTFSIDASTAFVKNRHPSDGRLGILPAPRCGDARSACRTFCLSLGSLDYFHEKREFQSGKNFFCGCDFDEIYDENTFVQDTAEKALSYPCNGLTLTNCENFCAAGQPAPLSRCLAVIVPDSRYHYCTCGEDSNAWLHFDLWILCDLPSLIEYLVKRTSSFLLTDLSFQFLSWYS